MLWVVFSIKDVKCGSVTRSNSSFTLYCAFIYFHKHNTWTTDIYIKVNKLLLVTADWSLGFLWWLLQHNWTYSIKSLLQISLVMASWLLEVVLLSPPPLSFSLWFFLPPSIDPPLLPFMLWDVSGGRAVLFSGNVLDDWKATWSDPRDTTCRRFISSVFFLLLISFVWLSWWDVRENNL